MSKPIIALLASLGLAATIATADAQYLYVPLTSYPADATLLELAVANPDPDQTHVLTPKLFAEGVDGSSAQGTSIDPIGVAPTATRVLTVPQGIGLLRLEGYGGLEISARLRVQGGPSQGQGDAVPILSGDNMIPAGTTAWVQSLIAADGYLGDFGLFNAGAATASCEARVSLAGGSQVGPTFALLVAPLSYTQYAKVPGSLVAGTQVSEVRVSMRCDQPFFVLSRTVNPQTGYVSIHTASTPIERGLTVGGGPPPPPPSGSPPAATHVERFTRDGDFFTPTATEPTRMLPLTVTPGVAFSELALSFTVEHGGWDPVTPDGVVNVAYLTRGGFTGDVFALITARGPNRWVVRNEITVDLPQGEISTKVKGAALEPGVTYTFDYLYSGPEERWTLTISDATGPVFNLAGPITGPVWTETDPWTIQLSQEPGDGHVASLGWTYSDLSVEWRP